MAEPSLDRPRPRRRSGRLPGGPRAFFLLGFALALGAGGCGIPRWPAEGPLASPFGARWRGFLPEIHRGVDIAVPAGTPVRASAGGRVRFAGRMGGYGRVVWVDHGGSVVTVYAHLSEIRVRTGERVGGGDVVGLSGQSGEASAPHLHFEIRRWGKPTDPVKLLGAPPMEE